MTRNEHTCLANMPATEWVRPMDVGGTDGSFHAKTLGRMVGKGWVEREHRSQGVRGSCRYRITSAGAQAAANHRVQGGGS